MSNRKYRLLRKEKVIPASKNWNSSTARKVHRIQALQDIPEHGVKKGDIGGYVSNRDTLSHEGSCWVDYGAQVIGHVTIKDDVYMVVKLV